MIEVRDRRQEYSKILHSDLPGENADQVINVESLFPIACFQQAWDIIEKQ